MARYKKHAVLKDLLSLGRQDHPAASLHWALYQEGVQVLPITSSQLAVEPKTCQSEVQEANKNLVTLGYKSTKVNHNLKTDIVLCFLPAVFKHITTHLSALALLCNNMNNNNKKKQKIKIKRNWQKQGDYIEFIELLLTNKCVWHNRAFRSLLCSLKQPDTAGLSP